MFLNRLARSIASAGHNNVRSCRSFFSKTTSPDTGKYEIVTPRFVSVGRDVPEHIQKPDYYFEYQPPDLFQSINPEIKMENKIKKMRESCRLAGNILEKCSEILKPGITTDDIDRFVHEQTIAANAYPSPLRYASFPKSVCTSVNNVVCHGIPDDRPLVDGDIINVDITVFLDGFHGDCSKTFLIGDVDEIGRKLVDVTELCLNEAIAICGPCISYKEIGALIEDIATAHDLYVLKNFIGHGIGEYFHGKPEICHYRNTYPGEMMAGMTFTIEPILSVGNTTHKVLKDEWTAVTKDNSRAAQFEHTILITRDGYEILTLSDKEYTKSIQQAKSTQ